jgi:NAD(P)-dependent dehydrogenase (short-subunit alcohol dehydrogenase family)
MGGAVASKLRAAGHTVIGVDIDDSAEVVADLSTESGRREAADAVLALTDGYLDGAVLAAGLGPLPGKERPGLITQVNYFGVVDLLRTWRPALAKADRAKVVVFSSNSTTTVPLVPRRAVRSLLAGDGPAALRSLRIFGKMAPAFAYAASKIAVSHWLRTAATSPAWIGAGIRLNAIAPGAILTPLLEKQLATPSEARQIKAFPVPADGYGNPSHLGDWVVFMLSDAADFLCGSVIFVDGGTDAYYRAADWPRPVPLASLPGYLRRTRAWRARRLPAHLGEGALGGVYGEKGRGGGGPLVVGADLQGPGDGTGYGVGYLGLAVVRGLQIGAGAEQHRGLRGGTGGKRADARLAPERFSRLLVVGEHGTGSGQDHRAGGLEQAHRVPGIGDARRASGYCAGRLFLLPDRVACRRVDQGDRVVRVIQARRCPAVVAHDVRIPEI